MRHLPFHGESGWVFQSPGICRHSRLPLIPYVECFCHTCFCQAFFVCPKFQTLHSLDKLFSGDRAKYLNLKRFSKTISSRTLFALFQRHQLTIEVSSGILHRCQNVLVGCPSLLFYRTPNYKGNTNNSISSSRHFY